MFHAKLCDYSLCVLSDLWGGSPGVGLPAGVCVQPYDHLLPAEVLPTRPTRAMEGEPHVNGPTFKVVGYKAPFCKNSISFTYCCFHLFLW